MSISSKVRCSSAPAPSPLKTPKQQSQQEQRGQRPRTLSRGTRGRGRLSRQNATETFDALSDTQTQDLVKDLDDASVADAQKQVYRRKAVNSLDEAHAVYDEYALTFSASEASVNKPKSREITAAVDRLKKIGNKVACMEGDDAADLAGNLVALADQIKPQHELLEHLRNKPGDFLQKVKAEWVAIFTCFPLQLRKDLLSSIGLSILNKLNSTSYNTAFKSSETVHTMRFLSSHVPAEETDERIHVGFISEQQGLEKLQTHLVVVVMEALLKLSKADYVHVFTELRDAGLAPMLDDHDAGKHGWCEQAWVDVSACSFLGYILEAQETGYKPSRLFFSTMTRLQVIKADVSVRLKTFRGAKKAGGDGDVGRFAWDLLSKTLDSVDGPSLDKLQDATNLWSRSKEKQFLPLEDCMQVPAIKKKY